MTESPHPLRGKSETGVGCTCGWPLHSCNPRLLATSETCGNPQPVELRCGMCDGDGHNRPKPARDACPWCDGTGTVMAHLDGKYLPVPTAAPKVEPSVPPTRDDLFTTG